ncbi:restriction endonuclease subunit S [Vibrio vulnificus]|uniref:restriction endonuclease subunit S n=1 Tax=Vibrio vulnificus TaxID=672 RepID=UPI002940A85C|nr:restriction endonuclease subunit S [Vibrio vulnificus]EHZ2721567.1 restriction endonuclease subunit S [Vibrio vulnificus]ELR8745358.1 restriction endonuclease subunit S [Vibrio vulnificus]
MVPNGWELTSFGKLAEFRNGLNFTKSDQGESIKIVGVADFKDHSSLSSLDNLNTIKVSNTVKEIDLIKSGDVLFVRSNGNKDLIGRCLFFPVVTEKLSFSGFTIRGRVTSNDILPSYLALLSRSEIVRPQFSKNGGGTNISNLSQQILNDVVIPLPAVDEQRKIAKILSTWDKAIATTEKLIETSKQQKKALMQQLLTGKKRLVNPETGKVFEGEWKKVELGELLDYKQPTPYLVKSTEYSSEYSTPVLTAGKTFILGYSNEDFGIFSEELPAIIFDDFTTASKFVDFPFKAKSSAMKILIAKEGVSIKYVYEAMQVLNYPVGGHQRHWISIFANLVIGLPEPEEQQKIASVFTAADKEIEVLEAKLDHLKDEKKALMQQLLTGKRRVTLE